MKMLRRTVLLAGLTAWMAGTALLAAEDNNNAASKMLRDAAVMLLKEGNERYVTGRHQHPNLNSERRATTSSSGQEPFATILGCADSRSPVELLFDRGVGDLFVIRVAGNVAGESELGSMEYGVGHLNTPVLVVLGHTKCGAVTAVTTGVELPEHLHSIADKIAPAAKKARAESLESNDLIPRAIQANVWNTMELILRESSLIRERVQSGSVAIVGAIYDLDSGKVSWLGSHPAQDAIVALADQAKTDAALAKSKESFSPGPAGKPGAPATKAASASGKGTTQATAPAKAVTATESGHGVARSSKALLAGGAGDDATHEHGHESGPSQHEH